jgi:hypothetical protein
MVSKDERLARVAAQKRHEAEVRTEWPIGTVVRGPENGYDTGEGMVTGYEWCEDEDGVVKLFVVLDGTGPRGTTGGSAYLPDELER